jgi:hypothetical protein
MSAIPANGIARTVWREIHQGLTPDDVAPHRARRRLKRRLLVRKVVARTERRFG